MQSHHSRLDSRWLLATGVLTRTCTAAVVVGLLGWAAAWALRDVL